MESFEKSPVGFQVDHFKNWTKLRNGFFRSSQTALEDLAPSSFSDSTALIMNPELEESEVIFKEFQLKAKEAEDTFRLISDKSKMKIRNVFEQTHSSDIYLDLSREITVLSSLLEKSSHLKKELVGTKRGEIMENMVRYMTNRINALVSESSATTEKFRQSFSRASSLPPTSAHERDQVSGQLRMILANQAEDDQALEKKEMVQLTRSITQIKSMLLRVSEMAVEQGATIDRIDFNLTQTVTQVELGNRNLTRAIEHSENRCVSMVIRVQVVMSVILFVLLLLKYVR